MTVGLLGFAALPPHSAERLCLSETVSIFFPEAEPQGKMVDGR